MAGLLVLRVKKSFFSLSFTKEMLFLPTGTNTFLSLCFLFSSLLILKCVDVILGFLFPLHKVLLYNGPTAYGINRARNNFFIIITRRVCLEWLR